MKKFMCGLMVLLPAALYGATIRDLERGVMDSDLDLVEWTLKEISLSPEEKTYFCDFAQNVIKLRYSHCKKNNLTNIFRFYKSIIAMGVAYWSLFGGVLLGGISQNEGVVLLGVSGAAVAGLTAAGLGLYDLFHINLRLKNAIKIKHFIECQDLN